MNEMEEIMVLVIENVQVFDGIICDGDEITFDGKNILEH